MVKVLSVIVNTNLGENKFSFPCKVFSCTFKIRLQFGTITAPNKGGVGIRLSFDSKVLKQCCFIREVKFGLLCLSFSKTNLMMNQCLYLVMTHRQWAKFCKRQIKLEEKKTS